MLVKAEDGEDLSRHKKKSRGENLEADNENANDTEDEVDPLEAFMAAEILPQVSLTKHNTNLSYLHILIRLLVSFPGVSG